MKKQTTPQRIKDPKKVAAGKARAAQAIRLPGGKFAGKIYESEVKRTLLSESGYDVSRLSPDQFTKINTLFNEAGLTKKDAKEFHDKTPLAFADLVEQGNIKGTSRSADNTLKDLKDYSGKIFIDSGDGIKQVSAMQARAEIKQFSQYVSIYANAVAIALNPTYTLDGKTIYRIPDKQVFLKKLKEYFDVTNYKDLEDQDADDMNEAIESILSDMGMNDDMTIISSPGSKSKK